MSIKAKIKEKIKNIQLETIKTKLRDTECNYKVYSDDLRRLENKVAIVTGGSGAIGSAICFSLAMQGATVGVCGRNQNGINRVIEQIEKNNGKAFPIILDVTNAVNISEQFKKVIEKYKNIDILVNNAGGAAREKTKNLVNQDIDVIDNIIKVNLLGTIYCSREVAKYMIRNEYGKIINMGSTTGVQGNIGNSEYSAAKSGLIGFTKSLAMELGNYKINVNCVSPGRVNQIIFDKPVGQLEDNGSYLNIKGETDDVAKLVTFLVSDEANYITGQNIIIDGGRSLGLKQ